MAEAAEAAPYAASGASGECSAGTLGEGDSEVAESWREPIGRLGANLGR